MMGVSVVVFSDTETVLVQKKEERHIKRIKRDEALRTLE